MATRRGYYREELRRAINNLEMALTHMQRFTEAYTDQHPEIAIVSLDLSHIIVKLAEKIQELHDDI